MAIKAYLGRMGSGKSYEVVSVVILGAIRRGRRVLSNIAGLNYSAMVDLLVAEGCDPAQLGELVLVDHEVVLEANFWLTDKDAEKGIDATIQPGDLVALDEIWRFWNGFTERGMSERVMNFVRMHRHFTHADSGVACDLALITQDIGDIGRKVRNVIEECYRMEKLTAIGATGRYRVDVFAGHRIVRKPLRSIQRSYEEKYFPLYKSHSQAKEGGAGPVEENIDGRGNVLKGLLFKVVLPLSIPVFIFAVWSVWSFLHPKDAKATAAKLADAGKSADAIKPGDQSKPANAPDKRPADLAESWRAVGWYESAGVIRVLVNNGQRSRWLVDLPGYKLTSVGIEVKLPEGGFATGYTGGQSSGFMPGGPK